MSESETQPETDEPYVKSDEEYLSELLSSDPVIRQLDEKIMDRKSSGKDGSLEKLRKEKQSAINKLNHAAKDLANILFRIQGATLMLKRRSNVKDLRYEKSKRIRYLRSVAKRMKKDYAKKVSSQYYRKIMSNKKVSPPEKMS